MSLGSRSDKNLADELESAGVSVISIGDCGKVGKIADATKSAYEVAVSL